MFNKNIKNKAEKFNKSLRNVDKKLQYNFVKTSQKLQQDKKVDCHESRNITQYNFHR